MMKISNIFDFNFHVNSALFPFPLIVSMIRIYLKYNFNFGNRTLDLSMILYYFETFKRVFISNLLLIINNKYT